MMVIDNGLNLREKKKNNKLLSQFAKTSYKTSQITIKTKGIKKVKKIKQKGMQFRKVGVIYSAGNID